MSNGPLRLGTRGSKLAMTQSTWVADQLRERGHVVEIVEIKTQGDLQQQPSLAEVSQTTGTQGLFTKELQRALLVEEVDFAVHSMKDLPTEPVDGLTVAAVPERELANDVLVGPFETIESLPQGARVGTGSLRRKAQLLHLRPDLCVADLRGNVDTRLRKLDEGQYDAIVLAAAGLNRLGLAADRAHPIPFDTMIPAPAQGALAIECRVADDETLASLASLECAKTRAAVSAERTAMRGLEGGCLAALGAHAHLKAETLHLSAVVLSEDGARFLRCEDSAPVSSCRELGTAVAESLLGCGAADLLRPRA